MPELNLEGLNALLLGFLITALVVHVAFAVASVIISRRAWRWALRRLGERKTVTPPLVLSLVVLLVTSFPAFYPVALARAGSSVTDVIALMIAEALYLPALIHAAYRVECIRSVSRNEALGRALAGVPYAGNRAVEILRVASVVGLPAFSDAAGPRAVVIAVAAGAVWIALWLIGFG
jgi:hypothetical protein